MTTIVIAAQRGTRRSRALIGPRSSTAITIASSTSFEHVPAATDHDQRDERQQHPPEHLEHEARTYRDDGRRRD